MRPSQEQPLVRADLRWIVLVLLALGLLGAGCAPITPVAAPAAAPASTAAPTAAVADITPEVAGGIKRVEEFLDDAHSKGQFTGAAVIAQDGKILWSKVWGMADREREIPNTPQTIYRINEMTAQFTAAAMLLLEQEGKLSLDDPICDYLDNCPEAWQPVTIHHLLSHTSGIPDYFDVAYSDTFKLAKEGATPDALIALFRDRPLAFEPGAQRRWSHSGFVLAGQLIEQVSGQPYGEFVEQHLMAPLGMTQSGYGDPPQGLAVGYTHDGTNTPAAVLLGPSALYASGGLYSTAEDLFRWNEGLYSGQLLNETQLQKMLTAHAAIPKSNLGSGYGIVVGESFGRPGAGSGGVQDGYAAMMKRYLDDRVTTLLIGNQGMDIFLLSDEIDKRFFGAD